MSADELIDKGFVGLKDPIYSRERIQRRHLCEAVCKDFSEAELAELAGKLAELGRLALWRAEDTIVRADRERQKQAEDMFPPIEFEVVSLPEIERANIQNAVRRFGAMQAARLLRMGRTTLYRKLRDTNGRQGMSYTRREWKRDHYRPVELRVFGFVVFWVSVLVGTVCLGLWGMR